MKKPQESANFPPEFVDILNRLCYTGEEYKQIPRQTGRPSRQSPPPLRRQEDKALERLKQNLDQAIISVMELSTEGIFIEDTEGNILLCNQAGAAMFGYTPEEMQALHIRDLRPADGTAIPSAWCDADGRPDVRLEDCRVRRGGELFPVEVNSRLIAIGEADYQVVFVRDMTESHRARRRLRYLANYDDLTTLRNRRAIFRYLYEQPGPLFMVMLDLDDFKIVNDTYGHQAGDLLLSSFGGLLRQFPNITAGRIGGEEFLLLIHTGSQQEAADTLQELLTRANRMLTDFGGIRFSAGGHLFRGVDVDECLRYADEKLYRVKRSVKNSFLL